MRRSLLAPGRGSRWAAGLLLGVFLILRLPASVAGLALPSNIQLRGVEGSLWEGQASAVGFNGLLVQEQLVWRFQPRALLGGRLAWAIRGRFDDQTSQLVLALGGHGLALSGVGVSLPLEPLAALSPKLKGLPLGASLRVTSKYWDSRTPMDASVTIDHLFTPLVAQTLGSYHLDIEGQGQAQAVWRIATVAGPLKLTGQGNLALGRSRFGGRVVLLPQTPIPGLASLLATLPREGQGYVLAF